MSPEEDAQLQLLIGINLDLGKGEPEQLARYWRARAEKAEANFVVLRSAVEDVLNRSVSTPVRDLLRAAMNKLTYVPDPNKYG